MNSDFLPRRGQGQDKNQHNPHSPGERPTAFHTPEQVAAADDAQSVLPSQVQLNDNGGFSAHHKPPKKSFKDKLKGLSKKQWALIIIAGSVVIAAVAFGVFSLLSNDDKPVAKKPTTHKQTTKPPVADVPTSTLTGLPITDTSVNELPVTAIMIENSTDARPQSGLNEAGVVFEAVAEGGITRFLTLWQDTAPGTVGPVRSVRPYYLQWLKGFDAPVAHVGGSGDALRLIKEWHIKDLDQFYNTAPYWRSSSRYAPHNMYASVPKLHELEAKKGFGKSDFTGFTRKKKETPSANVTARTIDFDISGAVYNSHYEYDPGSNSYLRSEGGQKHMDANTNQQINPKVVVGLVMDQGKNGIYTTYDTIGSGHAYIFQDGIVTEGTWNKSSNESQFVFKDANGNEIPLNPGRTWLTVVGSTSRVSYKP